MTTYATQQSLGSSGLTWPGATPEQLTFLKRVYDINLARKANQTFVNDVPANELSTVEGRFELRTNAAQAAINMLQAIRAEITSAGKNVQVGLSSAYRSASHQFAIWNDLVTNQYYAATRTEREALQGGAHGDAAASHLAAYTRARIATPGYSNHNNGLAIDIKNIQDGKLYRNKTNTQATAAWRTTWAWDWLVANAATYNFYQNLQIDEPWHWVYRPSSTDLSLPETLNLGEHLPKEKELDVVGRISGKILRGTPEFDALVKNDNAKIIFKDEEGTGADRYMTSKMSEKLNAPADLVIQEWGPEIKLRLTEAWDENNEHATSSVHYEGRGADLTTSDRDGNKLGRLAGLAVLAGFDWVLYEDKYHVHVSMKK
ncbi:D-alanyl-D-alanine carboxypeptidase family protein [Lacinutrix neustonica]|uniref:D-alanyl-D-alanine carboxypeptidase family protein n=1 Tax=Lacinutrix neustonica TaxID=2980107 RepID=A0A9E8MXD6_9FLAO|nr:D-alanyl-D-alanine carboxypeptidase family protein [Lacinutrix neustonica]WAC02650.1 D-alanyl-D-alanine carboxypeptidase family protein [Lacinutrix neustonica]